MADKKTAGSFLVSYTSTRVFDGVRALKGAAARCQVERVKFAAGSTLAQSKAKSTKASTPAHRAPKVDA